MSSIPAILSRSYSFVIVKVVGPLIANFYSTFWIPVGDEMIKLIKHFIQKSIMPYRIKRFLIINKTAKYNFPLLVFTTYLSIKVLNEKMWSVVLKPFMKPICDECIKLFVSKKLHTVYSIGNRIISLGNWWRKYLCNSKDRLVTWLRFEYWAN